MRQYVAMDYGLSDHMKAKVKSCSNTNEFALLLVKEGLARSMSVAREIIDLAREMEVGVHNVCD